MTVRNIKEPDKNEMLRKCLIILGFLVVFCLFSIPVYLLMTAGVKEAGAEVKEESGVMAPYANPATDVRTVPRSGGAKFTAADEDDDGIVWDEDKAKHVPDAEEIAKQEAAYKENISPEQLTNVKFKLNGFAFFAGLIILLILYAALFELQIKKQYYPILQGNRADLIASLIPLAIGILFQIIEITFIPTRITKGVASFAGIPWEIAYAVPAFMALWTIVGIWLDTNLNRMVEIDGDVFRYVHFGKGDMPLIIIPGLSLRTLEGSGVMLAYMYRIFFKDYSVYVMDKRDEVPEDVTLSDLAEDIAAVMKFLHVDRANVIGISMGGMIAQYLTLNHPEMVNKLVLGVTTCRVNDTLTDFCNHNITLAKKGEMETVQTEMFRKMYTREYLKKYKPFIPILAKTGIPKSNTRFIRLTQAILTLDTIDRLNEIVCPVLVLGGGADKIVGGTSSDEIVKELKCERYVYRQLGHAAYEEAKDFNDRIVRFFDKRVM